MEVKIECKGSSEATLDELKEFQGDLKELSDKDYVKLRDEIVGLGFSMPFFAWTTQNNKPRKTKDLIDGHGRKKVLLRMKEEGFILPDLFPIVDVNAMNKKQAKRKVLACTSQYQKMTTTGLVNFAQDAGIDLDDIFNSFTFDAIDFADIETDKESDIDIDDVKTISDDEIKEGVSLKVKCDNLQDLSVLQSKLGISGDTVNFAKFCEVFNVENSDY